MHNLVPGLLRHGAALAFLFLFVGPVDAATIHVGAGEDLQAALNAADPGDTILLEAGATFTGNFVLPVKSGDQMITISTVPDSQLPGPGVRISPSHRSRLAKIQSSNSMSAVRTDPGSHHWRIVLVEFLPNRDGHGEIIQLGDGSSAQNMFPEIPYEFELDRVYVHGDALRGQKRGIALNARAVTIRNSYIADIKGVGMDTQAIGGWNGPGPYVIENNYLEAAGENVMFGGADPSIPGLVSEQITFRYNHVSRPVAWRDPIVATPTSVAATPGGGGSLAAGTYRYRVVARRRVATGVMARSTASAEIAAVIPSGGSGSVTVHWAPVADISEYHVYRTTTAGQHYWVVTGTSFLDNGTPGTSGSAPAGTGDRWLVKNLFELKNARNVTIEGNTFENNWAHGQSGYAILFTPRNQNGGCTWCVVENVTFHANIVRNVAGGISILGSDDLAPSQLTANIRITHNLFYGVRKALGGHAWFIMMSRGPRSIVVDHNTVDADGYNLFYTTGPETVTGFEFTNNAARHNDYGFNGSEYSYGSAVINAYFPSAVFRRNWLQGGNPARYPSDNLFSGTFESAFVDLAASDYHAAAGEILSAAATDGTDIGAAMNMVMQLSAAATAGSLTAVPAPTNLRILVK